MFPSGFPLLLAPKMLFWVGEVANTWIGKRKDEYFFPLYLLISARIPQHTSRV